MQAHPGPASRTVERSRLYRTGQTMSKAWAITFGGISYKMKAIESDVAPVENEVERLGSLIDATDRCDRLNNELEVKEMGFTLELPQDKKQAENTVSILIALHSNRVSLDVLRSELTDPEFLSRESKTMVAAQSYVVNTLAPEAK